MTTVDYDLHGIVGVRVCSSHAQDQVPVERLLGPARKSLERDPDIVIRFEASLGSPTMIVERERSAFNEDHFFLLVGSKKVSIPFDRIGGKCEITCECGTSSVPLLPEIIQLTGFLKGFVPVHASAFIHAGKGVVVAGWTKGGKTETLLAFAENGAAYIGDEWLLLSSDGRLAFGTPAPVLVWRWHAEQIPRLAVNLPSGARAVSRFVRVAEMLQQRTGSHRMAGIMALLRGRFLRFPVRPEQIASRGRIPLRGPFDKLVFAVTRESKHVEVRPADAEDLASRMSASVQRELAPLMAEYAAFQFAFPDRINPLLENFNLQHQRALWTALRGKEAFILLHPYPAELREMFEALEQAVDPPAIQPCSTPSAVDKVTQAASQNDRTTATT